jgi:carboxyl-terminal processing protease
MFIKLRLLCLLLAVSLPGFCYDSTSDSVRAARKDILKLVVFRLKKEHFAPKEVDDKFSKAVWNRFITAIDGNKSFFIQSDIDRLKVYETALDEELNNAGVTFFYESFALYQQRVKESAVIVEKILSTPVALQSKNKVQLNRLHAAFPLDEKERVAVWRKRLTYEVFKKMQEIALQDSTHAISLVQCEQQAREKVRRWFGRSFKNLQSGTAADEKFSLYVNAVAFEMDPHTTYNPPMDARLLQEQMAHRYFGLGMELITKNDEVFIKRLFPGGAAFRSGLVQENDYLIEVSNRQGEMVEVAGMPVNEVSRLIRGDEGTTVKLLLRKGNDKERTVFIARGEVKEDEASARSAVIHQGGKKIGYIMLPSFYADFERKEGVHCADDVAKELELLKKEQVEGVVMDLRNNPGGSLDEVVKMLGYFLPAGPKVQLRARNGVQVYNTEGKTADFYSGPLTVLVNEHSASASEIFAAAIQDYHRGVIIGSASSYGKGTAQATFQMGKVGDPDSGIPNQHFGSIGLTMHKFYRVNGSSTQLKGVIPDIILPGITAYVKSQERDNVTALLWDTIPGTTYSALKQPEGVQQLIAQGDSVWQQNDVFIRIKAHTDWMKQHQDDAVPLSYSEFRKQQQVLRQHLQALETIWKIPAGEGLKLTGTNKLNEPDAAKRYEQWLQLLSQDVYLFKTVEIMQQLTRQL